MEYLNRYSYEGSVKEFDTTVNPKWTATTYATSIEKARSNLAYQYKRSHNKSPSSKITLPGKITLLT